MKDMANLQKLFTTDNSDSATNGFALKLRDFAKGLIAADGTVSNKSTALQASISRNGDDQDRVLERASRVEKQLRKQYSALDAQMAKMSGLSSYVTAQLAQWNAVSPKRANQRLSPGRALTLWVQRDRAPGFLSALPSHKTAQSNARAVAKLSRS